MLPLVALSSCIKSCAVQLLVTKIVSASGFSDQFSGRGTVPFISIISHHILPYKGHTVLFFNIPFNWASVLCSICCQLVLTAWQACLSQLVLPALTNPSTSHHLPCLIPKVVLCQYGCASCVLLQIMSLSLFMTNMAYECCLWSPPLGSTMTVHLWPPSSH